MVRCTVVGKRNWATVLGAGDRPGGGAQIVNRVMAIASVEEKDLNVIPVSYKNASEKF
ncbi:MAG: hypothetical protein ACFCBU_10085 [Cyanophyceae cyanobacterium]